MSTDDMFQYRNTRNRPRIAPMVEETTPEPEPTEPAPKTLPMEKTELSLYPKEQYTNKSLRATPRSDVFHYSTHAPSKYLNAPLLHVGSAEQAATVDTYQGDIFDKWFVPEKHYHGITRREPVKGDVTPPSEREGIKKYTISPEASIHPEVVSDEIANRAHAQFLTDKGKKVPRDITYAYSQPSTETVVNHKVKEVTKALHSGQLIPYVNTYEMEDSAMWPVDSDKNSMSYIVPNAKKNLLK